MLFYHRDRWIGPLTLLRVLWRRNPSWKEWKTSRCRSASRNAALHAGHRHLFLYHEALERQVLKRLLKVAVSDVCISVITKAELLFGVEVSAHRKRDEAALKALLRYVEVLDFPDAASSHYATIRADLKTHGTMIGANDLFIAVHACSLGLTLVTNNMREFSRVRGLTLENWAI